MNRVSGQNTLFATIGQKSGNGFHLSVNDGKVEWLYAVAPHQTIFNLEAGRMIPPHKWFEIIVKADKDID